MSSQILWEAQAVTAENRACVTRDEALSRLAQLLPELEAILGALGPPRAQGDDSDDDDDTSHEKPDAFLQEWLDEMGDEVDADPEHPKKKKRRLPAVPNRTEVVALMTAPEDPRDRLVIRLLYAGGLREGELCNLLVADLALPEGQLFIRNAKGDKDRYGLIDPITAAELAEWTKNRPPDSPVFIYADHALSTRTIQRIVTEAGQITGIAAKYAAFKRHLTPHSLRHAYATHCYENGMDLFTLKKLLGHNYLDTTEMYVETGVGKWRADYLRCHELVHPNPTPPDPPPLELPPPDSDDSPTDGAR